MQVRPAVHETAVCRYCEQPFPVKPGSLDYPDECPACLVERAVLAGRPSGLKYQQVARNVRRLRQAINAYSWSSEDDTAQRILKALSEPRV